MFLYRWLWENMKGYRAMYVVALIMTVICQSMFVITPYFTQQIIDTFIFNDNAAQNLETGVSVLIGMIALMIGFNFIRTVIQYSSNMMCEKCSQEVTYRVRRYLYRNMQNQDAAFYDHYRTGDIMTRMSGDIDMVRHSISWIIKTILESVVMFLASTIYFYMVNPIMATTLLILTPVIFIVTWLFNAKVGPLYVALRERLSNLNTGAEENIAGNRVVKAFAREEYEKKQFAYKNTEYSKANKTAALTWLTYYPFIEGTASALAVIQLVVGGIFVINGVLTMGEFTIFQGLIWTLANPMRMIGNMINDLQRFTASANKLIEIYYGRPKIVNRIDAKPTPGRFKGDIKFENVVFKYGNKTVLNGINLDIKASQTVAIMGETGSGKTTLINLISRIYDVNSGAISIDGTNIRLLKKEELRHNIGVATQDVLLFSDTVEGNIAFGDSSVTLDEAKKYAADADCDGFIRKMNEGYDTIIGERGVGLSGGQKQRIALARALAIKPSILILDDTTSAVDLETEKHIQKALLDFPCTKIIIAQRITSTKHADKIVVLKNGQILEEGTHDELIQKNGYYREVYDLQK